MENEETKGGEMSSMKIMIWSFSFWKMNDDDEIS